MIWALLIIWLVLSMFVGFLAALGIMVIGFFTLVVVRRSIFYNVCDVDIFSFHVYR